MPAGLCMFPALRLSNLLPMLEFSCQFEAYSIRCTNAKSYPHHLPFVICASLPIGIVRTEGMPCLALVIGASLGSLQGIAMSLSDM